MFLHLSTAIIKSWKSIRGIVHQLRLQHNETFMQSELFGARARKILSKLTPFDVINKNKIRVGHEYDGGYVMIDDLNNTIAYSFGISDDVSWDSDIANRGIDVFMYDHTINGLPTKSKHFHFFKTGITGISKENSNLKTIEEIIIANGHKDNNNLILKCDIEGAEWEAFAETPSEIMSQFKQIVVEFHGVNDVFNDAKFNTVCYVLDKLNETHQVVHVHCNNYGSFDIIGGVPMPNTYEVTYLIKEGNTFKHNTQAFTIKDLDRPNNPSKADYYLGNL